MTDTSQVAVLEKARELIVGGWTRGRSYWRHHGKAHYCLAGALSEAARFQLAAGSSQTYHGALSALRSAIRRATPNRAFSPSIVEFNDGFAKSKHAILQVIDDAIRELRGANAEAQ